MVGVVVAPDPGESVRVAGDVVGEVPPGLHGLKAQAAAHHRTLGEHLEALSQEESRRDRFRAVRAAMAQTPPDDEYAREVREWQSDAWN